MGYLKEEPEWGDTCREHLATFYKNYRKGDVSIIVHIISFEESNLGGLGSHAFYYDLKANEIFKVSEVSGIITIYYFPQDSRFRYSFSESMWKEVSSILAPYELLRNL
jgi:hypothetical protein